MDSKGGAAARSRRAERRVLPHRSLRYYSAIMGEETESKYSVDDFGRIRRRLRALGAAYQGTVVQTDTYLDSVDRSLLKSDSGLRLRRMRWLRRARGPRKLRAQLTFKGPRRRGGPAKLRTEVQTRVDDADAVEEILRACGLAPMIVVEKRRATYRLGRCTVELDELPLLGRFVEIEGPDEAAVLALADELRLPGEPIAEHYVRLLADRCGRVGNECLTVTFDRCTPRCRHRP